MDPLLDPILEPLLDAQDFFMQCVMQDNWWTCFGLIVENIDQSHIHLAVHKVNLATLANYVDWHIYLERIFADPLSYQSLYK